MRQQGRFILVSLGWLLAAGCGGGGASSVQPGDTVQPVMSGFPAWVAGKEETFKVRLQATSKGENTTRELGFEGIPNDANPEATITFYVGKRALEPIQASLSHRC